MYLANELSFGVICSGNSWEQVSDTHYSWWGCHWADPGCLTLTVYFGFLTINKIQYTFNEHFQISYAKGSSVQHSLCTCGLSPLLHFRWDRNWSRWAQGINVTSFKMFFWCRKAFSAANFRKMIPQELHLGELVLLFEKDLQYNLKNTSSIFM